MKTKLILLTITGIIAVIVFFSQKSQVKELKQEQDELHQSFAEKISTEHSRQEPVPPKFVPSQPVGNDLEKISEQLSRFMDFSIINPDRIDPDSLQQRQEIQTKLLASFAGLSHQEVFSIIPNGPYDFDEFEDEDENIDPKMGTVVFAILLLTEQNPKEALLLIREVEEQSQSHEDITSMKVDAFRKWSKSFPQESLAWYEEEQAAGAADLENFEHLVLSAKAVMNPKDAIDLALNRENPKEIKSALYSLQSNIKDLAGHRLLLSQLNEAQKAHSDFTPLTEFRTSYLHGLNRELTEEHYEDAVKFVSENYTPEERSAFAEQIYRMGDLPEPAKWATWLSKNGGEKAYSNFVGFTWGKRDPEAVGKWLNQQPESTTKQNMVRQYAFHLASTDKESAIQWAETLPESKRKQKLLRQIEEQ